MVSDWLHLMATGCEDRWLSQQADEPTLHQGWIWYMVDGTAGAEKAYVPKLPRTGCAAEGEIYKVEREVVTGEIP